MARICPTCRRPLGQPSDQRMGSAYVVKSMGTWCGFEVSLETHHQLGNPNCADWPQHEEHVNTLAEARAFARLFEKEMGQTPVIYARTKFDRKTGSTSYWPIREHRKRAEQVDAAQFERAKRLHPWRFRQ